jgi:hypothetical protein
VALQTRVSAATSFPLKVANFNAAVLFLFRSKERDKQKALDYPNSVPKRAEQKQSNRSGQARDCRQKARLHGGLKSAGFLLFPAAFFVWGTQRGRAGLSKAAGAAGIQLLPKFMP